MFVKTKQTFLQAELCQILARELGKIHVPNGFGIISLEHVDRLLFLACQSRRFSVEMAFLAADGYADSLTSTGSISHRGEELCS